MPARWLVRLGMLAVLAVVAFSVDTERLRMFMPIRYVRVEGDIWNLDTEQFQRSLSPLARAGYFSVDLAEVEKAAKAFAWIDDVQVLRVWPDTLVVRVVEQAPVARWGETGLLNGRGMVFSPPNAASFVQLPSLSGPAGQEQPMYAMLRALNSRLKARHVRVAALKLSGRRAWTARLDDGMDIVIGRQEPLPAVDRLLALLPRLGEERVATIVRVDLRYPNGFAVVFRPEATVPAEPLS